MNVESISSFTAHLYKVEQLRYRPARKTCADIIVSAQVKDRPGQYNQDAPMADRYGADVDKRGTIVPFPPLSIYKRRRPLLRA
jgi:hypothetical protein